MLSNVLLGKLSHKNAMKYDGFGLAKEGSFSTLIQLIQIKTNNNIFLGGSLGRREEIHN